MDVDNGQMGVHAREENMSLILALDPGRDKTGFAFCDSQGRLLVSGIFASCERDGFFRSLKANESLSRWILEGNAEKVREHGIKFIALGNGTGSKEFRDYVASVSDWEIGMIDENNTTLEARRLYWQIHKPGVFMRLLPESLRVPGRILDDLAAWAIALRALQVSHEKI